MNVDKCDSVIAGVFRVDTDYEHSRATNSNQYMNKNHESFIKKNNNKCNVNSKNQIKNDLNNKIILDIDINNFVIEPILPVYNYTENE